MHVRLLLRAIQARDRARLGRLQRDHPGVRIDPRASSNLAVASWTLGPAARVEIGADVVTERDPRRLRIAVGEGAELVVGDRTWLRTEVERVQIVVYPGARIEIGPEGFMNGCLLSAKSTVRLGFRVWIGPGSRVYDSDQHDLDADHPESTEPVQIGDYSWVASDVTVLKGVEIGGHCVVGTRSLVSRPIPPHSLAYGSPAARRGPIGDRSSVLP